MTKRLCGTWGWIAMLALLAAAGARGQVTWTTDYDLAWGIADQTLYAWDELGRTVVASPLPMPSDGIAGMAIDPQRRVWISREHGFLDRYDPAAAAWTSVAIPQTIGGAIAIDAAGRVYCARTPAPLIRVYDGSGTFLGGFSVPGTVYSLDIDPAGRVIANHTSASGAWITLFDGFGGVPGQVLATRPGTPQPVRARPGGGYVAMGFGPSPHQTVTLLDQSLATVDSFVASPLDPSWGSVADAIELPDGGFAVRYATVLLFPTTTSVAYFSGPPYVMESSTTFAGQSEGFGIDGRGRMFVRSGDSNLCQKSFRRFDRDLRLLSLAYSSPACSGSNVPIGDFTGMRLAQVAAPAGDLDDDGLSNAQEIQLGSDPLDPWHHPARITQQGPLVQGQSSSFVLAAPLDAGRLYMHAWTTNLADRLPLTAFHPADWRVFGASPYLAGSPGVMDPAFLLSTSIANPWFVGTIGTLDATGSATTSVNAPPAGLPPNVFRLRSLFYVIAGAPYPNDLSAISDSIVVPLL